MSAQNALKFSRPRRSLQISFKWLSKVSKIAHRKMNDRSLHAVFLHLEKFLRAPLLSAASSELFRPTSMLSLVTGFELLARHKHELRDSHDIAQSRTQALLK